jgi:YYY domain-containing protein
VDSFDVIVKWYLVTTLVSVAFTPLALVLFRRLTDRGATFARTLSMLLFVWPAWFLSGIVPDIVPFNTITLWITIILGGAASWAFAIRKQAVDRDALFHVAFAELGYLIAFAGYVWFRGYDPTIQWQEKLSDLMMLSSSMQAESMPPNDAWLAGETINYYYMGYVPWAAVGKIVGTIPSIAYNLALASVFASSVIVAVGVAGNVVGRFYSLTLARVAGALGALFVIFMATPWSTFTAIDQRDSIWNGYWYNYMWDASRQLDGGGQAAITEFPSFSFQLGDLHPHVLALPFTILALGMAWMLVNLAPDEGNRSVRAHWPRIVVAGGVTGALYAMNSWDYPAYLLLAIGGLAAGTSGWAVRERLLAGALLVVSSIALWAPFYVHFESPTAPADTAFADAVDGIPVVGGILASIAGWNGSATTLGQYAGLFGYAWFVGLALIAWEFWNRRNLPHDQTVTRVTLGLAIVIGLAGLLMPVPLLILAGLPFVLILLLWQRDHSVTASNVALALFGMGFVLTLIPEFLYLLDVFNNRMNIVFKLYYQSWVMFALGAAIGLVVLWNAVRTVPIVRVVLPVSIAAAMLTGLTGTVIGMNQWTQWRFVPDSDGWIGMDGLYFLEKEEPWAGEYGGIEWLYENASEDDVMLSAGGCEFTLDIGTTASGSGIATIIGWQGHENQWHLGQPGFQEEITTRVGAIHTLWDDLDPALLDEYGVTLIYIGPTERNGPIYPDPDKLDDLSTCAPGPFENANNPEFPGAGWTEVYTNDEGVRIYRRDGA